jgi:hypothetical protein
MRTVLVVIVVLLVGAPGVARAEPDPTVATGLATAGTAVPVGGLALGLATIGRTGAWKPILATSYVALLVAPSAGHFYSGDYVSTGFGIRVFGAVAVGVGFLAMECDEEEKRQLFCIPPGVVPVLLGTVTMLVGAGWDMATADNAAESASTQARMFSIGGAF